MNTTMARPARVDLRSFQQELADRLAVRSPTQGEASRLAFSTGDEGWLASLDDTGEVLAVPSITPVPLAHPWYLGIANIRGNLHGVVDFAAFLGRPSARLSPQSRVVLFGSRIIELKAALLVERVIGLRNLGEFEQVEGRAEAMPWFVRGWRDEEGRVWRELDVARLARDHAFLQVGR